MPGTVPCVGQADELVVDLPDERRRDEVVRRVRVHRQRRGRAAVAQRCRSRLEQPASTRRSIRSHPARMVSTLHFPLWFAHRQLNRSFDQGPLRWLKEPSGHAPEWRRFPSYGYLVAQEEPFLRMTDMTIFTIRAPMRYAPPMALTAGRSAEAAPPRRPVAARRGGICGLPSRRSISLYFSSATCPSTSFRGNFGGRRRIRRGQVHDRVRADPSFSNRRCQSWAARFGATGGGSTTSQGGK